MPWACIAIENENVKVVFLPPNTTALLQPLNQGIIRCVKATYTRLIFERIRAAIDAEPNIEIMECWKSFIIANAITFIKAAMDELKPDTVNACWKNLWSEVVNDFKGFPAIDGEVKKIIRIARQVGGEGFVDMIDEEVEEHREVLPNEELEELVKSSTEEEEAEEEETETEPAMWTLKKFGEMYRIAQTLKEKIKDYDPMMERSIKVTRIIVRALETLQQMFDELKRKKQHFLSQCFFKRLKNIPCPLSTIPNHQHRLLLTSNHRHRLLLLQLRRSRCQDHPKQMILLLTTFHQKVNSLMVVMSYCAYFIN
jgi:hypothetical protein